MVSLYYITIAACICAWGAESSLAIGLNCTINNLSHNYLTITDPVYDTDTMTNLPYTYKLLTTNVTGASINNRDESKIVALRFDSYAKNIFLTVKQIDEKSSISKYSNFFYNFTINLRCQDRSVVNMYSTFRLIDSNNHEPFFEKPQYTYKLFSSHMEDFYRLQALNPITANDYDVTNGEVIFSIESNKYFDIKYNGIVPGTKNKKHYAQIVPKVPGVEITQKLTVDIIVTDTGYPPRKNVSSLVINPPSPPAPTFLKQYYVGHYYRNRTLWLPEQPQLQGGTAYYETKVKLEVPNSEFTARLVNGEIIIIYNFGPSDLNFYKYNYIVCTLKATYTDSSTKLYTDGYTNIIIEYHHD